MHLGCHAVSCLRTSAIVDFKASDLLIIYNVLSPQMAIKTEEQTVSPHPILSLFSYKFSDFTLIHTRVQVCGVCKIMSVLCHCLFILYCACMSSRALVVLVYNKWSHECFCDLLQSASISTKTLQLATRMASYGKLSEFHPEAESISAYLERVELFFTATALLMTRWRCF